MNALKRLTYKILNRLLYSGRFGDVALRRALLNHLPVTPLSYVDVGAFDGSMYRFIAAERNITSAVLVEPQKKYVDQLKNSFARINNVQIVETVLMAEPGDVTFHENTHSATSSTLEADEKLLGNEIDISGKKHTIRATTLDEITAAIPATIGLLKIDVQGAELQVLRGGSKCLARTDFVWIEVSFKPLYKGSPLVNDIVQYLEARGFILINLLPGFTAKSGELLQADCLFKKKLG